MLKSKRNTNQNKSQSIGTPRNTKEECSKLMKKFLADEKIDNGRYGL